MVSLWVPMHNPKKAFMWKKTENTDEIRKTSFKLASFEGESSSFPETVVPVDSKCVLRIYSRMIV